MKTLGDYIEKMNDIFKNTKAADILLYIVSVISSLFRGN